MTASPAVSGAPAAPELQLDFDRAEEHAEDREATTPLAWRAFWMAATLAAYVFTGKLGLAFAFVHESATPIWAPTGIAIAAFLLGGHRMWPAIFIGAYLVNITTSGDATSSLAIAVGNTFEGLVGGHLIQRYAKGTEAFDTLDSFIRFALVAAVATTVSATIGVTSLALLNLADWAQYPHVWFTWWVGDTVGALVVTPLIVCWGIKTAIPWSRRQMAEAVFLGAAAIGMSLLVFGGLIEASREHYPMTFLPLAVLMVASMRLYRRGVTVLLLLSSGIAVWGTYMGYGPFAIAPLEASLLLLEIFMGTVAFTGVALATATVESIRTRERLQKSEAKFRSMIEKGSDAVCLLAPDGSVIYANDAATRILGYPTESFVGGNLLAIVHPDEREEARRKLGVLARGGNALVQMRCRCSDGSWKWLECMGTNLSPNPHVGALLYSFRDITDRKQEETIRSQFVSLSSHQLRTPITVIRWALNELRRSEHSRSEDERELLHTASATARSMADLTERLLTLSAIDRGDLKPLPADTDVRELFEQIRAETDMQFRQKSQRLEIECEEGLRLRTDRGLLKQLLQNVVVNASKYSPEGNAVTLRARKDGNRVALEIEDRGYGIPLDQQHRVFSLFFRGGSIHQRQEGGGLGLYVVHAITQLLQGTISFRSREGEGTTFFLSLPETVVLTGQTAVES